MERKERFNFWCFVIAFLAVLLLQHWLTGLQRVETIAYSKSQDLLREGKVAEISIAEDHIRGRLHSPLPDGRDQIYSVRVDSDLARDLETYGITYTGVVQEHLPDHPAGAGGVWVAILAGHLRSVRLGPDIDAEKIAELAAGFSGADLANPVKESAILATRHGGEAVTMDDVVRAIERIVAIPELADHLGGLIAV